MNNLVIKANNLIEGIMDMSHNEHRFTLYLISKINKNDKEFRKQKVNVKEFAELIGCEHDIYGYMRNMADTIVSHKIKILGLEGEVLNVNWFSYTNYVPKTGTLEIAFNNDLVPFLLNIDVAYTKYFLSNVRFMKSKYSIRIYELLKQYEKIGTRIITLEDIRMYLGISPDEYKFYADFKKRVISTSQKELKEYSDICFEFEEIKASRKITAIKFIIRRNSKPQDINNQEDVNNAQHVSTKTDEEELNKIINDFNSKYNGHLDFILTKNLVQAKGLDCVKECVKEFVNFAVSAKQVERVFYDFTMKYKTERAYVKSTSYNNSKPIQATNYEQRDYSHYTEKDWMSFYCNVEYVDPDEDK